MENKKRREDMSLEELLREAERYLNYPEDEEEYRLVKCMEKGEYDEVTKIYPLFGTTPWYTPLLEDKYVKYFNDLTNIFGIKGEYGKSDWCEPMFEEFERIVFALFSGNKHYWIGSNYTSLPSFKEYLAYQHYIVTCPEKNEKGYIQRLIRTTHNKSKQELTADERAARMMYRFQTRMGLCSKIEQAKNGDIGRYLNIIKEKSGLPHNKRGFYDRQKNN